MKKSEYRDRLLKAIEYNITNYKISLEEYKNRLITFDEFYKKKGIHVPKSEKWIRESLALVNELLGDKS